MPKIDLTKGSEQFMTKDVVSTLFDSLVEKFDEQEVLYDMTTQDEIDGHEFMFGEHGAWRC